MGNSKIPAYDGCGCGRVEVPVARVWSAPTKPVDYLKVLNKPSINGVELVGDRDFDELGYNIATQEQVDELFGE